MGADAYGDSEFVKKEEEKVENKCQGEWIGDCPFYPCKCIDKYNPEPDQEAEDFIDTIFKKISGAVWWVIFLLGLMIALYFLG